MRTIRLRKMTLSHFKGCGGYVLEPNGRSATIRGTNGAGKTTLADAWSWCMTGRSAAGQTDFAIKTIGHEGADHAVTVDLEVDGEPLRFSRTYREKRTKKRGSSVAELTGHETLYQIDGVPVQEREWLARIATLAPPETWNIVSSPHGFAVLPWQRRRAILAGLCGEPTLADVVASDPELADLPGILGQRTLDDHRRTIAARRRDVRQELTQLPARIDELDRQLSALDGLDKETISARATEVERLLSEAQAGAGVDGLRRRRSSLQTNRHELIGRRSEERDRTLRALRARVSRAWEDQSTAQRRVRSEGTAAAESERLASEAEQRAESLREEFRNVQLAARAKQIPGVCGRCGQPLPEHMLEEARQQANAEIARTLSQISERGKRAAAQAQEHARAAAAQREAEAVAETAISEATALLSSLGKEEAEAERAVHPLDEQIDQLDRQVADLDKQIAAAQTPDAEPLRAEQRRLRSDLARLDGAAGIRQRAADLEAELQGMAAEDERIERELWLLDRYAFALAMLTEARVNGLFRNVEFRLFRRQVNGGIDPCCDILVAGVPHGAGLNKGAEVVAGLEIVRVLQQHYGLAVPIFLDGRESVVEIPEIGTQVIGLVVDGAAKEMEVEYE